MHISMIKWYGKSAFWDKISQNAIEAVQAFMIILRKKNELRRTQNS